MNDPQIKVTMLLKKTTLTKLDEIVKETYTGSRGRCIDYIIHEVLTTKGEERLS